MSFEELETDYLIVGAGAMGMAFADVVLTEDPAAQLVLVDRHARPGGHWNDAYGYVSLHQPAAYYGVPSENLGTGGAALASGQEVLAYYDKVTRKFLDSGRVRLFPMCEYRGDGAFASIVDPDREYRAHVRRKRVDATYMNVQVPSVRGPRFPVAEGANIVAPNALTGIREPWAEYVVIGAGKTGMDAVLFLLQRGVSPAHIRWIISNEAWLFDRAQIQPGVALDEGIGVQMENVAGATSVDEVFTSLERDGRMLRLDPDVWPTKFRCATVSKEELVELRRVGNVVRMGRVQRLEPSEIVLDEGTVPTTPRTLHVDCTADGLARREPRKVFDGDQITLQSLFMCQQVYSAAVIGHIEMAVEGDDARNALAQVVPHPELPRDYLSCMRTSIQNSDGWLRTFPRWLRSCRLNLSAHESLWTFLRTGWQMRRILPAAMESMDRILEEDVRPEYSSAGAS